MAQSGALLGFGSVLEIALATAPSSFTYIAETISNSPPSFTDDTVEVTHSQSPNKTREYIGGLTDSGSSSHEMNYIPGSATDTFIQSMRGKNLVVNLTFPNGRKMIYAAVREGYETTAPTEDRMTATLTLKVSGDPVLTPIAAPRNIVAPTIDDTTPVVGAPIVVDQGVWAGATDLTYQWEEDGTPISGATKSSYVPVASDVGAVLTCVVTGTNASFSTSVETAGTSVVAAS